MATQQEQLEQLKNEQEDLKVTHKHFFSYERRAKEVETLSIIISAAIVVGVCIVIYHFFSVPEKNNGGLGILLFYAGLAAIVILAAYLAKPLGFLFRLYFKISQSQLSEFETLRKNLEQEKNKIEQTIQSELKQQHYRSEYQFFVKLNHFVNLVIEKKLQLNDVIERNKLLRSENEVIRRNGYQIHTNVYYSNRFNKIDGAIQSYNYPLTEINKEVKPNIITQTSEHESSTETKKPGINKSSSIETKTIFPIELNQVAPPNKLPDQKITIAKTDIKTKQAKEEEEKTVTEIFGEPNAIDITEKKDKLFRVTPKQNYQALNKQKMDIGDAGELFIFWKEKNKLFNSGFKNLSDKVQHISKDSDSYGYDIVSYFEDGTQIYLEVKTTTGGPKTPFDISSAEIESMNKLDNTTSFECLTLTLQQEKVLSILLTRRSSVIILALSQSLSEQSPRSNFPAPAAFLAETSDSYRELFPLYNTQFAK